MLTGLFRRCLSHRAGRAAHAVAVYGLFAVLYVWSMAVFVGVICRAMWERGAVAAGLGHAAVYFVLTKAWLSAFYYASTTKAYAASAGEGDPSGCGRCGCVRGPRTHHCGTCGRCVPVFDHHCPWIADNCVGAANYRFFVLVTLYGAVSAAYLLAVAWFAEEDWYAWAWEQRTWTTREAQVALGTVVVVCTGPYFAFLFAMHMHHIVNGVTHFEVYAKLVKWEIGHSTGAQRSVWANLVDRLGPSWHTWLVPFPVHDHHAHNS